MIVSKSDKWRNRIEIFTSVEQVKQNCVLHFEHDRHGKLSWLGSATTGVLQSGVGHHLQVDSASK